MKQNFSIPSARGLLFLAALVLGTAPTLSAQDAKAPQRRGWLGFAFDSAGAVVVRRVEPGSPAARAGLQPGDTVIRFNGRPITAAMLINEKLEPGDTVRLGLRRKGLEQQLVLVAEPRRYRKAVLALGDSIVATISEDSVRRVVRIYLDSILAHIDELKLPFVRVDQGEAPLGFEAGRLWFSRPEEISQVWVEGVRRAELPDTVREVKRALVAAAPLWGIGRSSVAGAEFTELNPGLAQYFEGAKEGLLVLRVAPGTPAEKAGLEPGDVVVAINGRAVRDISELRLAIARPGQDQNEVRFEVVRKGKRKELSMSSPMPRSGVQISKKLYERPQLYER